MYTPPLRAPLSFVPLTVLFDRKCFRRRRRHICKNFFVLAMVAADEETEPKARPSRFVVRSEGEIGES